MTQQVGATPGKPVPLGTIIGAAWGNPALSGAAWRKQLQREPTLAQPGAKWPPAAANVGAA
eukprot:8860313-Alexandrium_andersonii.AAC.1